MDYHFMEDPLPRKLEWLVLTFWSMTNWVRNYYKQPCGWVRELYGEPSFLLWRIGYSISAVCFILVPFWWEGFISW